MIRLSLGLPKYRLDLHLVKRRGPFIEEPLLPTFEEIKNTRSGNKISRFFRHVFEHKQIKKILGGNFALLIIASSLIPTGVFASQNSTSNEVIEVNQTPLKTEAGVQLPVPHLKINQGFFFFHPGVDLGGDIGDPIKPVMSGVIEEVQYSRFDYGDAVIVNHGNGIESLYAHLSKINVKRGDEVNHNTVIGLMGETGHATGPHLHLEIHDHGRAINPFSVLPR